MKRYEAYDPKEYLNWEPDHEVMKQYNISASAAVKALKDFKLSQFTNIYKHLLQVRLHDIALKRWVKSGVISKAWLGCGEEASTVGAMMALEKGDLVGPMIRNAGAVLMKGMPVDMALGYYLGVGDNPAQGRDLHAGSLEYDVITPISSVAALVPVCNGLAMALRMKGRDRVVMTWVGDGATRTGEFHEGVNFAAVQELPCIFVLQNNQVALGTAYDDYNDTGLESLAEAYGIKGLTADGNNVLDVFQANAEAVSLCREGQGPVMLTVNTFRMGGHASHDEAEARELFDEALFADWGKKDPIGCYEEFLIHLPLNLRNGKKGNFVDENRELLGKFERFVQANTDKAVAKAILNRESRQPAEETVGIGVFAE